MYRLRLYRPAKTIQFFFGTAIHQTLDLAHEHYLGRLDPSLKGSIPNDRDLESYFIAAESSLRTRGIVPFSRAQRESALNLLKRFNRHYGPTLYPRVHDTECRLQMDLGKVVIQGVVDVLLRSASAREGLGIWDYKGTELPSGEMMRRLLHNYELQMQIYALLYSKKYGNEPQEAVLVFLNELKSDPPSKREEERAFFRMDVNSEEMQEALQEFMRSVEEIENERAKEGVRWRPPPVLAVPERRTCDACDFRWGCESAISAHGYAVRIPKAILAPSPTDRYVSLPWKQSRKRPDLGTILVTVNLPPLGRELYERLKAASGHVIIESDAAMYRLWIVEPGRMEYLQRWSRSMKTAP